MSLTSKTKTALAAGLAALTLGAGTLATSSSAEARPFGVYRGGYGGYGGFHRAAFYGPRYYRPAFYGGYYRPYYRPYGGAVAAGLIGGLAVGALASSAYASPYYVAAPGYGYGYGCTVIKKRFVDDFGQIIVKKTRICQ